MVGVARRSEAAKDIEILVLCQLLIINQHHMTAVLAEYKNHFSHHRPHRALAQAAPLRALPPTDRTDTTTLRRHDRLGGLIHEYRQVA